MQDQLPSVAEPRAVAFDGAATFRASTNAAGLCGAIVQKTAKPIQGRRYVSVEGWQAIAIAHGCAASAREVEKIDGGVRAIGEVRRMADGALIAQAEGFVGDDESMWAKRPVFARRAMAQTRAISRACRSAFAHVVVMIDADLGTTPAEEMEASVAAPPVRREKVASVTGEAQRKIPTWTDDQKMEVGAIFQSIIEAGGEVGEKDIRDLRQRMKYDAPSDVIDAAAQLLTKWRDIQAQAAETVDAKKDA